MSLRAKLHHQLKRWDDDTFAALANRGLLRRAGKDLEAATPMIASESDLALEVEFGGHRLRFDARGPGQASCTCPTSGVCQHILAVALWLQRESGGEAAPVVGATTETNDADALAPLHAALLRFTPAELTKHAGKPGYRWAWQFVQDLDPEQGLRIAGSRNVVIGFLRPKVDFRYPGGGLDALLADAEVGDAAKYRVAAVLAYQRAHGVAIVPPEPTATPRTGALDLGKDHALPEVGEGARRESRARLRTAVRRLIGECIELGLSHLSQAIADRYATLAVWAQGAEYHRLARALRRLADHVELLLARAGSADEHRLLEEATLVHALVAALEAADARGAAPAHLVGRARNRYEASGALELLGVGALPWRAASGYVGLTMILWSPTERVFVSCTDARPESQRFDPIARYRQAGPWAGLGAPEQATGKRVRLEDAQTSDVGRLSASDKTQAKVEAISPADFGAALAPVASWAELAEARAFARRSLLVEPEPLRDWVVLAPAGCGAPRFDATRQVLEWPLRDTDDATLLCEVAYSDLAHHVVERLHSMTSDAFVAGTLVVAKLREGPDGLVAEPLSLVRTDGKVAVDALYFDAAPAQGLLAKALGKLRQFTAGQHVDGSAVVRAAPLPPALDALRVFVQRQAERGLGDATVPAMRSELAAHACRLGDAGLPGFAPDPALAPAEQLLRAHYLQLQLARLLGAEVAGEDATA